MNTIRSTWLGWGVLTVAGAGSYYFAKRSINADRQSRFEEDQRRKRMAARMEEEETAAEQASVKSSKRQGKLKESSPSGSPSSEASHDPAPTIHSAQRESTVPKSKYEPSEPYRSRKGDRFS